MGIFDGIGDALGGIGDALSEVTSSSWFKPAATIGLGLYGLNSAQKAREGALSQAEQAQWEAYKRDLALWEASQGGGGGGRGINVSGASRALKSGYNQALDYLAPYVESGKRVLPKAEAAYTQGLAGLDSVAKQILTPELFATLNNRPNPRDISAMLPSYVTGEK